jgi:hypothetical protein
MNSSQIRHKNFHTLFEDFITRHPNQPRRGMLKQFAQHLKLSERYLSHIKCQRKNIGNSVARVIEDALGLPQGWMDREHDAQGAPVDDREKLFIETALILFRAHRQLPNRTSCTWSTGTPARSTAARIATAPTSLADKEEKSPWNAPMGVRAAPTITMGSFIFAFSIQAAFAAGVDDDCCW